MTQSIYNEKHSAVLDIKFGDDFPAPHKTLEIFHPEYGECEIYVTKIGEPKWTQKLTVEIPIEFYINDTIEKPIFKTKEERIAELGLKVIDGGLK